MVKELRHLNRKVCAAAKHFADGVDYEWISHKFNSMSDELATRDVRTQESHDRSPYSGESRSCT
jgi:hypothetical protein